MCVLYLIGLHGRIVPGLGMLDIRLRKVSYMQFIIYSGWISIHWRYCGYHRL